MPTALKTQHITVRVPASTSNLGPGFDCLGIALRIYNTTTISLGEGGGEHPPMVADAAARFFEKTKRKPFRFRWGIRGDVPQSRGLGSSVTVRLGVLHGLNGMCEEPLGPQQIFRLCADMERHPDNAAPAQFGGFNVARGEFHQRFDVSARLRFVLVVPELEIATHSAREILPEQIGRIDAVRSCGNACAITAAFAAKNYYALRGCFRDHLHQRYRQKLIPFLPDVIAAAERVGALGAFLSGSGSTIAAITLERAEEIGAAMRAASGLQDARIIITRADRRGTTYAARS